MRCQYAMMSVWADIMQQDPPPVSLFLRTLCNAFCRAWSLAGARNKHDGDFVFNVTSGCVSPCHARQVHPEHTKHYSSRTYRYLHMTALYILVVGDCTVYIYMYVPIITKRIIATCTAIIMYSVGFPDTWETHV